MRKMLLVMAHPDDESFGPGATIARYAANETEIHLLCATKGESGQWSNIEPVAGQLGAVRDKEHQEAADILGIKSVEYLGLVDGTLSNLNFIDLVGEIRGKILAFQPEVILTFDLLGISGHLDHIAMALASTRAFESEESVKKLYYYAIPEAMVKEQWEMEKRHVWGRRREEMTTVIEAGEYFEAKIKAANYHRTQADDVKRLMPYWEKYGKEELFVLGGARVDVKIPENDLFAGV